MRRILSILILAAMPAACDAPTAVEFERILTLQVAAQTTTCQQWFGPTECLQVRRDASDAWEPLYEGIVGFTREDGFEYELRVAEFRIPHPPADGSSRELRLVRVLKRVQVPPG